MDVRNALLVTLCLLLASACASATTETSSADRAAASADELVAHLGRSETSALEAPESEAQIAREIERSVERWPEDWRFRAFRASHLVRIDDWPSARIEHEEAKRLYEQEPYWIDPAVGDGVGASSAQGTSTRNAGRPLGILVSLGILTIVDGAVEDEIIAYPSEPSAKTWLPPEGAYTKEIR
jgi:hypothetical protein